MNNSQPMTTKAEYSVSTENKTLTLEEKRQISKNILLRRVQNQLSNENDIEIDTIQQVVVFTAYSDNYSIGKLCEQVNRSYCVKHGYKFECFTLSHDEMVTEVSPRQHCTWYKIKIINKLLSELHQSRSSSVSNSVQYIFWIDSDAIFINHDYKLENFIQRGKYKNLIIAEDMNQACLINAGVMLIKVNDWSLEFWKDVWNCHNYFDRPFYDQSAIIKILKSRNEGLNLIQPFHSYVPGGPHGDKYFPNVVVLPHLEFNTNYGFINDNNRKALRKFNRTKEKLLLKEKRYNESIKTVNTKTMTTDEHDDDLQTEAKNNLNDQEEIRQQVSDNDQQQQNEAKFIFHAAGRCNKLVSLNHMITKYAIQINNAETDIS